MPPGLRQITIDGRAALCLGDSPVAAVRDPAQPSAWYIVVIGSTRVLGWTRGSRAEVREKLIQTERELRSPTGDPS